MNKRKEQQEINTTWVFILTSVIVLLALWPTEINWVIRLVATFIAATWAEESYYKNLPDKES